jgi:CRP-like cAMP-binding protein
MDLLLQSLSEFTRLPHSQIVPLTKYFNPVKINANTQLLSPGALTVNAWFVAYGLVRVFYYSEEKKRTLLEGKCSREITNWIAAGGGFLTDVRGFLNQAPATSYIESLEASELYSLSYSNYLLIHQHHPNVGRLLFENSLIMADMRVEMCNLRHPENRLVMFERLYPGISGRISVNVLASYLNVDPTTLSRLRSKRSNNSS